MAAEKIDKIGVQLYTVRGEMKASVERTLKAVADIGYKEVEFHDYFGRPPRAIRQLLDRNGLKSPACHVSLDSLRDRLAPHPRRRGRDRPQVADRRLPRRPTTATRSTRSSAPPSCSTRRARTPRTTRCASRITTTTSNSRKSRGSGIYDILLEECDPKYVDFEMDLYWATKAGASPLDYFAKHPGRFPLVHVKDAGPAAGSEDARGRQGDDRLEGDLRAAEAGGHQALLRGA